MTFSIYRSRYFFTLFLLVSITTSAKRNPTSETPGRVSLTTGRPFNKPDTLPVAPCKKVPPIPGMVYIEGGYMSMGNLDQDKLGTGGCGGKPVTVTSFYMDKAPITNLDYREYLYDLEKSGLVEAYKAALPNQEVVRGGFSYNDPYLENYLYAPAFSYYPVVGVSWEQANAYCQWRTKKVGEEIQKRQKKKNHQVNKSTPSSEDEAESLNNDNTSPTVVENLPVFRLPTEAEWEYAARAIVGTRGRDDSQRHQRTYPWDGSSPRGKDGQFLANFKRGKGNYKGMAGESDHAAPTSYVYAYPKNDVGLFDMVGNVCCWVSDTYSPLALQETSDFNPIKSNESVNNSHRNHMPNEDSNHDFKVYKGCSWADSAYFLQIGTRRYLHKDDAAATIGFRCVVSNLGR